MTWAALLPAQGNSVAPGHRLINPLNSTETWLVDTNSNIVHTWNSTYQPGTAAYLLPDGSLLRSIRTSTTLGVGGEGGGVQRALDGTVLWEFRYDGPGVLSHHDLDYMPNGNILMIAWEEKSPAQAIAAGRDPSLLDRRMFRPDHVIEVEPTGPTSGRIVWEWHIWDHLVQDFDPFQANFGIVSDHPERIDLNFPRTIPSAGDWNHVNTVSYEPVHDWIVLCPRSQSEVWIIDHSTTTEEARTSRGGNSGKGGDLLYRWGNPAAYRRGDATNQQLFGHHGAYFIPDGIPGAGNILVFNNQHPGGTAVWEFEPPITTQGNFREPPPGATYGPTGPIWSLSGNGLDSRFASNAERLPNGNTLVCAGFQGLVFETNPNGQPTWLFASPFTPFLFHAHYYERYLWASSPTLSIDNGGTVNFELIAGSAYAGRRFVLLGSLSGTAPGTPLANALVPLNVDSYFLTTLNQANQWPLTNSSGFLDANGRATSALTLPPRAIPPQAIGTTFYHAALVIDSTGNSVSVTTNPVATELVF